MPSDVASSSTTSSMNDELNAASPTLVGNADVLRSVLARCGDCIKILDLDGRLQFMSDGGKRVMEVENFSELKGCPWPDFWEGIGNIDASQAVATAKAGGIGRFKGAANTAKGNPRYWDVQVSPIVDDAGKPTHLLSISRDITEEWRATEALKDAIEQQALLTAELQHRIKNTLAIVSAIANQTMRGESVPDARQAFSARLFTLSHAHDILTQTSWVGAPIKAVVEGALAPHRTGQRHITIGGPDVELLPKQALAIALAVHELATNAVKYGALSTNGTVNVEWTNDVIDAEPRFRFIWTEKGGPKVTEPLPAAKGFGSRLISRLLEGDFSGKVTTTYAADGLVCELNAPLIALKDNAPAALEISH